MKMLRKVIATRRAGYKEVLRRGNDTINGRTLHSGPAIPAVILAAPEERITGIGEPQALSLQRVRL